MSSVEVDSSLTVTAKHDVSNDVGKITKDDDGAQIMDVETVGNGQPEQNSTFAAVKKKSVADANGEKSQSDINAAKAEELVREKHDTNGSSSPVKRKQVSDESDSESEGEDRASPTKKPRSEAAKRLSDEEDADSPTKMSDEDIDSSVNTGPKKRKRRTFSGYADVDDDELGPALLERPIVLEEGQKREKKKVQRLELTPRSPKKQKQLSLEEGSGTKLRDIPRIEFRLQRTLTEDLKPLHRVLFDRTAVSQSIGSVKKNIRQFSGFTFSPDSDKQKKKMDQLTKIPMRLLKSMCNTLDLEQGGNKEKVIKRLFDFLMEPKSSGKPLPSSANKSQLSSKVKKSSDSKGSAQKTKVKKPKKKKKKEEKESGVKSDAEDESRKSVADSDEDADKSASSPAKSPKPPKKKKKPATPVKKTPKVQKKTPKSTSAKKAKKPPKKSKASSSESSGDESDEGPLVKKEAPPTDDMLKSVVKKILKTADLEEVTMKTVCKQVYDKFPGFDLTSRKDFIKATVKQILK